MAKIFQLYAQNHSFVLSQRAILIG